MNKQNDFLLYVGIGCFAYLMWYLITSNMELQNDINSIRSVIGSHIAVHTLTSMDEETSKEHV